MDLLNIIIFFIILFGAGAAFVGLAYFLTFSVLIPFCHKVLFRLIHPYQNRRLLYDLKKSPVFSKFLAYAESNGIAIEKGLPCAFCSNTALHFNRSNKVCEHDVVEIRDLRAIYIPWLRWRGVNSLAHEIGHVLQYRRKKFMACAMELKDKDDHVSCPWSEWIAWIDGEIILRKLKIPVNKKRYWENALHSIYTHKCLRYPEKCPQATFIKFLENETKEEEYKINSPLN
ncbi:MAG: hypothetical protein WC499_00755 [Patescibacteria group bacterium]